MNRHKNFIFHVALWLLIWATAWIFSSSDLQFVSENGMALIFQIVVIAILIYYTIPQLLLKKKYMWFTLVSIATVFIVTLVLSNLVSTPNLGMNPDFGPGPGIGSRPHFEDGPPLVANRRPPSRFFINLLLIAIAYAIATLVELFLFAQKKEEEIIINKNEALQTELKLLKSQINPHFLFNALNNIYALSAIDSGRTQQSISYLSDMLRYVLYECEQEIVPLYKEIDYIENYIKLFSLKSSKIYPITTTFSIENQNVEIVPMLLIPFLENALKHSNIEKIKGTFINLKITATSNFIDFEIENSKPEVKIIKDDIGGIGIDNVKKRLAILYPDRHHLTINKTSQAFKVNLKLQLHD
ncbi:sensor histidine kinase [Maribacter hydrothermalis]|uniref:Histidine kinase n=1 Tax=Maribacter hydrothermalis TaxID=1836467 RepID=A0A1B7Z8F7_9FLAO|nr:histidine kinase [Maribacter hydrothermalis]APQ19015.1 histidine kinase [Maribacter hydrothermalis]OBR38972.1 histidine kinase [Maribacter hydrothermalis]